MSRIGKKPIIIPKGVEVKISKGGVSSASTVFVQGPKGALKLRVGQQISVQKKDNGMIVEPREEKDKRSNTKALWGLTRSLLNNIVIGVSEGFQKQLEIQGVGYRAQVQGKKLILELGFSHPIEYVIPRDIEITIEKNIVTIKGIDKQKVGQVAAEIRALRKPEPYKGKGVRYVGEYVRRKVGKKAVTEEGTTQA